MLGRGCPSLQAGPSQCLPTVKAAGNWSLTPSAPVVPRQGIRLEVPIQGPLVLSPLFGQFGDQTCSRVRRVGILFPNTPEAGWLLMRPGVMGQLDTSWFLSPSRTQSPRLGALTQGHPPASCPQGLPSRIGPTSPSPPPARGRSSCGTLSWSCCRRRSTRVSSPGRGTTGNSSSRTPTRWLGSGGFASASPT